MNHLQQRRAYIKIRKRECGRGQRGSHAYRPYKKSKTWIKSSAFMLVIDGAKQTAVFMDCISTEECLSLSASCTQFSSALRGLIRFQLVIYCFSGASRLLLCKTEISEGHCFFFNPPPELISADDGGRANVPVMSEPQRDSPSLI